jgi:hypothetical protein
LGEWIEFGRNLQSASDEEILSLIGSVAMYLKDELNDETFPSTHYNYREYVRGYANTILKLPSRARKEVLGALRYT